MKKKSKRDQIRESATYFLRFFKKIPSSKWIIGQFFDQNTGACCALGHLGRRGNGVNAKDDANEKIAQLEIAMRKIRVQIVKVNDGKDPKFKQRTAKSRVVAALTAVLKKVA